MCVGRRVFVTRCACRFSLKLRRSLCEVVALRLPLDVLPRGAASRAGEVTALKELLCSLAHLTELPGTVALSGVGFVDAKF